MSIAEQGVGGEEGIAARDVGSYRRLADVYHHLLSEQTLDALLDTVADALSELLSYDTLTIYEADHSEDWLVPVLVRDEWADEIFRTRLPFGEGITGWVVQHQEPILSNEAHLDSRVDFIPGTPVEPEALISVPLVARGSVKGALNVYRQGESVTFTQDEFELAQRFAEAAALAIDNAQIRAALEHQAQTDPLTGLFNHRYFHERLRSELLRSSRNRDSVGLILFDIDDFKKLNDVFGHASGDNVLVGLSDILRATVRASDVACRVGGEEFAVILPSCDAGDAMGLVRRLRDRLAVANFDPAGNVTLSVGLAQGPEHASNPRELVACAEMAMMTAKARGKDQAILYDETTTERPGAPSQGRDDVRSIAHLKMLQSLAGKLNRLNEVRHIADTISDELRTLIDYHNCRVYIAEGSDLLPVAFRGDLASELARSPELLSVRIGEGIAGRAASTGRSLLVPNALECEFAVHLPGTDEIEETIIAVPMLYGSRVNGVVLISQLGVGQFDEDDVRLLEVLAGQASVALENARLYESQRREAENARSLLELADRLLQAPNVHAIANLAVEEVARMLDVEQVTLWLREGDGYRCVGFYGFSEDPVNRDLVKAYLSTEEAARLHEGRLRPYVATPEEIERKFPEQGAWVLPTSALAPLLPGAGVDGWLSVRQPPTKPLHFSEERLRYLEGLSHQVSVALQKASLYRDQKEAADVASSLLDFSHEVSSVDNLDLLLERIVERGARILGSPQAMLWLQDPSTGDVVCEAIHGFDLDVRGEIANASFPASIAEPFLTAGKPFVLTPEDYASIPNVPQNMAAVTCAVAPFSVEGRMGCLVITAPALGDYHFSERKMHLLAGIADQTKLALTNATAYQTLEGTFLSTVEALANALEANDEYTSSHARSIAEMTREIGAAAGLDPVGVKRLEMAALFHDIGKIGIPSEILLKPGPLDEEEWTLMRRHPELGERILEPIERLADVRPIVRHCHEHYDGSGYPDGLKGEEIPLEARIILVCDAFNAMTTDRPYRSALEIEEALSRLESRAGTQFDPDIVALFTRTIRANPIFGLA